MKLRTILVISTLCLFVGALFFLFQRKWIIVQFSFFQPSAVTLSEKDTVGHKSVKLYYWKHEKWNQEEASLIWHEHDAGQNLKQLIKQWLTVMTDERLIAPHVALESVAVSSQDGHAYVSFDRSLFSKEWTIYKKWMILEGLFKSIRFADSSLQNISLFVGQQPMEDDHLDLSMPLPIQERA